jgi:hypothetical protein
MYKFNDTWCNCNCEQGLLSHFSQTSYYIMNNALYKMCILFHPIIIASHSCWFKAVLCIKRMCDNFNFCFSEMTTEFHFWVFSYCFEISLYSLEANMRKMAKHVCSLFQEWTKVTGICSSTHVDNFVTNCVQIGTECNWKQFWNKSFLQCVQFNGHAMVSVVNN